MATPGNQPSSATCTDILRCSVVEFSVSSSWDMMPKCDLVLRDTDVVCTVKKTVKCKIKLEDFVGISIVQKPHPLNPLACQMDIHSYPLVAVGLFAKTSRRLTTTSFCFYQEPTFRENLYAAVQWKKAINKQCRRTMRKAFCCEESDLEQTAEVTPLQLLIFINPFGGPGKAQQLFEEQVLPMFNMAEVQSTIVVTKRQNHARDVVKSYDFSTIDGIVVSSGDGLIFEVVNGIMERADWETAIRKPIGILPTGSGNGISASLLHESEEEYSLTNAAFLIIRGCPLPMDVATVETHDGGKCYMSLAMAWGLVADVDIESEKMRKLGETRFVLGSVKCIVKKNVYQGILHYLPLDEGHSPEAAGGGATAAAVAMATEHSPHSSAHFAPPTAAVGSQSANAGQITGTEGRDAVVEGRDAVVEGRDAVVEGRDAVVEGRDAVVEGRDAVVEGRDAVVEGRDAVVEGRDAVVEGRDAVVEGRDAVVEGRDAVVEGRDAVVEGRDAVVEGRDAVVEGRDAVVEGRDAVVEGRDAVAQQEHAVGKQEGVDESPGLRVQQEQEAEKRAQSSRDLQGTDSIRAEQTQGGDDSTEQSQDDKTSTEQSQDDKTSSQGNHTVTEQSRGGDSAVVEQSQHSTGTENLHNGNIENGNVPVGLTRVPCGPHLQLLPHLSQSVPGSWKTMPVNLLSFSALLTSHLSRSFVGDPTKHIGSGGLRVVVFRSEMSRFDLLKVLTDSESGKHLSQEHVTVLEVSAFRLEVVTEPGMITVDGEAMPYGTLQVELHPRVARLMCRKRRQEGDTLT